MRTEKVQRLDRRFHVQIQNSSQRLWAQVEKTKTSKSTDKPTGKTLEKVLSNDYSGYIITFRQLNRKCIRDSYGGSTFGMSNDHFNDQCTLKFTNITEFCQVYRDFLEEAFACSTKPTLQGAFNKKCGIITKWL